MPLFDSFVHAQILVSLTGRVDIRLSIDIPADTELVEPLHKSCICCQARGAATEVSLVEGVAGSSEKVFTLHSCNLL